MRGAITYEGKRYYVSGKDEKDLAVKKAMKLKELEEGKKIESNMLVRDWAKEWMETYKIASLSEKQYKDYQSRLNKHILPEIGHLRLKDVKVIHLQKIMKNISDLSGSRMNKIYQCLNQLFVAAEANELIQKNPVERVEKPNCTDGTHRPLTEQERKVILKVAETHTYGLLVKLMLYCGMRPGEVARCKASHFDFKKKLVFIDGTKSGNAPRYVPVPQKLLGEIQALKIGPFDYLLTTQRGTMLNKEAIRRRWKAIKRAMHIEMGGNIYRNQVVAPYMVADDLVPYCLRHTYCTDLQDAGVPINVAKELMGHSDISLTAKIYTHYTETSLNNAAELLQQFRDKDAENATKSAKGCATLTATVKG